MIESPIPDNVDPLPKNGICPFKKILLSRMRLHIRRNAKEAHRKASVFSSAGRLRQPLSDRAWEGAKEARIFQRRPL
jgi:hypothetical protein